MPLQGVCKPHISFLIEAFWAPSCPYALHMNEYIKNGLLRCPLQYIREREGEALLGVEQNFVQCKTLYLRYFAIMKFYKILQHLCLVGTLKDYFFHDSYEV